MSQELLLAVTASVAGIVLLVGLIQALAPPPRRRRRRVRRRGSRVPPPRRPGEASAPATTGPRAGVVSGARRGSPAFTPRARPAADDPVPAAAPPAVPPRPAPAAEAPREVRPTPPRAPAVELPLERCLSLYESQQYQEVVAIAEQALRHALGEAVTPPAAGDMAKLWSVLALSRQALGDDDGALSAFEEAIHVGPEDDRPIYQKQVASLAANVGRRLLGRVDQAAEGAGEEQIRRLRQAVAWLRQARGEVPDDPELASALERARHGLWTSCNEAAAMLIQRQEFHRARRIIREALADADFPPDRRDHFTELLSTTFAGEIGQLTANAIRTLEDEREREALGFLERAEGILSGAPPEALTPKRREDANRRLWWGYTKLGMRRVEAGEYGEALEPLFHALKIGDIGPERQQETKEALVRALERVTDARGAAITQLAKDGNRSAAAAEMERLKSLMRESLERGLSQQELSLALTKARRVMEALERLASG